LAWAEFSFAFLMKQDDDKASANATKSTIELEALCTEQAAMIKQLNCLVTVFIRVKAISQ